MNTLIINKKKWEVFYEYVVSLKYGDVILHKDISSLLQEAYGTGNYRTAINRARKDLVRQGKEIESVHGKGYRVVEPDNYTQKAVSTFKQGFNRLKKAGDLLISAPVAHMSEEGRVVHRNVSDRARMLHAAVAGGCVELNLLSKKPSAYLPENIKKA